MKSMKNMKRILALLMTTMFVLALSMTALAADEGPAAETAQAATEVSAETAAEETTAADSSTGSKAMAAALCVGVVAAAGAISMGLAISKSSEGISRQPEASGDIRTSLMLGLVFIETAIIYGLIVAILIIFVL